MNEAELVLSYYLGCSRSSLYLNRNQILDKQKGLLVATVLKRRIRKEPLAYILGKQDFMGFDFFVDSRVLIPRQDTEVLVETVLKYIKNTSEKKDILDIGTGSGCIAISLALLAKNVKIVATDISPQALNVARCNAENYAVLSKINFVCCDLFPDEGRFDLIVSNPPYIKSKTIPELAEEIQYEPTLALDGGEDGLFYFRKIIQQADEYLKEKGILAVEIGFDQKEDVLALFTARKKFKVEQVIKDYNGIDRVVVARKN
ncbi:MAG: peptide chain release factor N(5)-glutamine methyltransferase [Candidatus Omnitrophica bacterium]|nr:peptide chain release factor N(5)-glutamine methyltransferase [Candidatus Omnitrophota bacterium]